MAISMYDVFQAAQGIGDVWEAEKASNRFFDIIQRGGHRDPYPTDPMAKYRHYRNPYPEQPERVRSDLEDLVITIAESGVFGKLEEISARQRPAGYPMANYDIVVEDESPTKQEPTAEEQLIAKLFSLMG